jgi:hypothetical protein
MAASRRGSTRASLLWGFSAVNRRRGGTGAPERRYAGRWRERVAGEAGHGGGGVDVEVGRWIAMERNRVRGNRERRRIVTS